MWNWKFSLFVVEMWRLSSTRCILIPQSPGYCLIWITRTSGTDWKVTNSLHFSESHILHLLSMIYCSWRFWTAFWTPISFGSISRMYSGVVFGMFMMLQSQQIHEDVKQNWKMFVNGWTISKAASQSFFQVWIKRINISWTSFWVSDGLLSKADAIFAKVERYLFWWPNFLSSLPTNALIEVLDWVTKHFDKIIRSVNAMTEAGYFSIINLA